jgi:hypothetical protein
MLDRLSGDKRSALIAYRELMTRREDLTYETLPDIPIKGSREFVEQSLAAIGERPRASSSWTPEMLAESVAATEGISLRDLRRVGKASQHSRLRLTAAYLGRLEGFSIASMAKCLCREESTFSRGLRRLELLLNTDPAAKAHLELLASRLHLGNTGIHD